MIDLIPEESYNEKINPHKYEEKEEDYVWLEISKLSKEEARIIIRQLTEGLKDTYSYWRNAAGAAATNSTYDVY